MSIAPWIPSESDLLFICYMHNGNMKKETLIFTLVTKKRNNKVSPYVR